ncbi:N-6 DNA methylase [Luteimonas sp. 3794]|uniref:class I SAM-dependent DNA methyltransferase n=1 Tax=Luteimonas sp. 3794 TaxID=2817730 RepID=UPI00285A9671|nr:N-6 DNA methylase [Luteimonas sp. 3794]MDR6993117.1 type I restriction enzyme M protein [Luteimonas sp. 3794]
MSLESQSERFIKALEALGGRAGNQRLQGELGWADGTYQRVKGHLLATGEIAVGRGRGGSVSRLGSQAAENAEPVPLYAELRGTTQGTAKSIKTDHVAKVRDARSGGYSQAFNAIDKAMRNDEGLASELDYAEQTSWLLFLKYLDDMEHEWADEAALEGKTYAPILARPYRWQDWAAPKIADGRPDPNAVTGSDLIDYVNGKLVPHLKSFKDSTIEADSLQYKIGEIFSEVSNRFRSGYTLRDVLQIVDTLSFGSSEAKHELSELYETRIKRMGNAGRNGGEYYTPRPLIRAMIEVVQPQIGETIYDGACGSAGFLCEAWAQLRRDDLSAKEWDTLQRRTFYGQEKKSLAYVLGVMNMILHGIDAPNIRHANTLSENVMDIQQKDRHDIVLANPPFGGGERKEVQQNFPIRSSETAYLFLQHFIRKLKAGGRGAVVIKNTFLSNTDNASVELRRELLASCNLHTILDCPSGTFQGAGVKTVVLFFDKGVPTRKIWYYQLDPGRSMGKTNPLNDADLAEFVQLQKTKAGSEKSWTVNVADMDATTCDLSVKNPHEPEAVAQRTPQQIIDDMLARDVETAKLLATVRGTL